MRRLFPENTGPMPRRHGPAANERSASCCAFSTHRPAGLAGNVARRLAVERPPWHKGLRARVFKEARVLGEPHVRLGDAIVLQDASLIRVFGERKSVCTKDAPRGVVSASSPRALKALPAVDDEHDLDQRPTASKGYTARYRLARAARATMRLMRALTS